MMSVLSQRRLVIALAALLALAGLGLATSQRPEGASAARGGGQKLPNIVVVTTDDQALSQARARYMPKVTKLIGRRGTRFPNAFLTTPLCCPSRATLLTGQYGHNNGVLRNTYPALRNKRNVLPVWLRRAGYVTAHVGKFLNRYHHFSNQAQVAPGWDQWYTEMDRSEDDYYDWYLSRNGKRVHFGRREQRLCAAGLRAIRAARDSPLRAPSQAALSPARRDRPPCRLGARGALQPAAGPP